VNIDTFRFGLPPSTPRLTGATQELRLLLGRSLGRAADVTVSQRYDVLARNLLSGAIDACWAPPLVAAMVEPQGATVVAQAVRRGKASYAAAFVVRADDRRGLAAFRGARVAWVDPLSVAGHLLPVAHLRRKGLDPERLFSEQKHYGSYAGALSAVEAHIADIAAVHASPADPASVAFALLSHGRAPDRFRVVELTESTPSDAIVLSPGHVQLAERLSDMLLRLPSEDAGPLILEELFHADSFVRAPKMSYKALYFIAPK
jgi:ABC-type phosphate/phosphonate transport system substrate-binding protein